MAKPVTRFVCSACGNVTSKWSGRCEACGEWNTIAEEAPLSSGPGGKEIYMLSPDDRAKPGQRVH